MVKSKMVMKLIGQLGSRSRETDGSETGARAMMPGPLPCKALDRCLDSSLQIESENELGRFAVRLIQFLLLQLVFGMLPFLQRQ